MTQKSFLQKSWVVASIAFLCCALWGSAFAGVKIGYETWNISSEDWASQILFAGIRFALAGCLVLIFGSFTARKPLLFRRKSIPKIIVICLFQTILQYFFYYIGLAHTTGVNAAIIVAANVFVAILLSCLVYRTEKMTTPKLVGCIIGFLGILLCNLNGLKAGVHFSVLGDGFIFLCTIASGFSSVYMKKYSAFENPVLLSGWQFLFGGLVMGIVGHCFGGAVNPETGAAVILLLYLSFVSAAAYSLWAILLKYNPVSKVAVYGFLNPVCGVLISAIFLSEKNALQISTIFALLFVCVGIYIVNHENGNKSQNKFDK